MFGENSSLIRFWAEKFAQFIKPVRNKKGNRLFTAQDVANFKIIYYLVKEQGMTLDGAIKRMKDNITGVDKRVEVISRLTSVKERLLEVSAAISSQEGEEAK